MFAMCTSSFLCTLPRISWLIWTVRFSGASVLEGRGLDDSGVELGLVVLVADDSLVTDMAVLADVELVILDDRDLLRTDPAELVRIVCGISDDADGEADCILFETDDRDIAGRERNGQKPPAVSRPATDPSA